MKSKLIQWKISKEIRYVKTYEGKIDDLLLFEINHKNISSVINNYTLLKYILNYPGNMLWETFNSLLEAQNHTQEILNNFIERVTQ